MKSKPIVLSLYSSITNTEISTASHTIRVALTSIAANVTVSNWTGANPGSVDILPLAVKRLDVKTESRKMIKLAINNPAICGFNGTFLSKR